MLNFVPTPEKLDRFQIKNDLELLGGEVKLKMYFKTEATKEFLEKPAFRVPIRDI